MHTKLTKRIFDSVLDEIAENGNQISDESIEILISLFKTDFLESLEFIDENCVSLYKTPNNFRQVFEVKDQTKSKSKPDRYFCVIDANYCSCDDFRTAVLNDSKLFCKHIICCKLSYAMRKFRVVEKTDDDIDRLWTKHIMN